MELALAIIALFFGLFATILSFGKSKVVQGPPGPPGPPGPRGPAGKDSVTHDLNVTNEPIRFVVERVEGDHSPWDYWVMRKSTVAGNRNVAMCLEKRIAERIAALLEENGGSVR